jgi:DNA-binding GntR family transcriptional regulator
MRKFGTRAREGKRQPLYCKIAEALEKDIRSGKYPIGSKLPTEHQLVAQLEISRATAIAALNSLEAQGFVYRRPRTGTEVVSRYPIKHQAVAGDVFHDWARIGTEYKREIIDRKLVPIPARLCQERPEISGEWLHLVGVRHAPDMKTPICIAEIYVHPDYASISSEIERFPSRVFTMIEEKFNLVVRTVQQEMRAVSVEPAQAALLGVSRASPALEIVRWYRGSKSKIVEITVDTHPGNTVVYKSEIHRGEFE